MWAESSSDGFSEGRGTAPHSLIIGGLDMGTYPNFKILGPKRLSYGKHEHPRMSIPLLPLINPAESIHQEILEAFSPFLATSWRLLQPPIDLMSSEKPVYYLNGQQIASVLCRCRCWMQQPPHLGLPAPSGSWNVPLYRLLRRILPTIFAQHSARL